MKDAKNKAAFCIAGSTVFMALSLLLAKWDIWMPAGFAAVLGLMNALDCFFYGREYEEARKKEQVQELPAWYEAETGTKVIYCRKCGCERFQVIGGRMVCMCCGHVAEVDRGET